MELKKFRNKYHLELIPASHENILLGTLVWDPLIGKPRFDHPGMPEHIYNAFLDAGILNNKGWTQGIQDLHREGFSRAQLADMVVQMESNVISTLENPMISELEQVFELEKVQKFNFGNLQVRTMSNLNRIRIDNYLEILKEDNWKTYDGKIRRVHMITELYYGSVELVLEKKWKNQLEASIKNTELELEQSLAFGKQVAYSFSHRNVPFAMRLEKLRDFNG